MQVYMHCFQKSPKENGIISPIFVIQTALIWTADANLSQRKVQKQHKVFIFSCLDQSHYLQVKAKLLFLRITNILPLSATMWTYINSLFRVIIIISSSSIIIMCYCIYCY